jgi:serine/threonine protein kinase
MFDVMEMNRFFIPIGEEKDWNIFMKAVTLTPEIVSPETIVDLMTKREDLNPLFNQKVETSEICRVIGRETSRSGISLGKGSQGEVYYIPSWRSDAVVKLVRNAVWKQDPVFTEPVKGVYYGDNLVEVLSGSLASQLLPGKSHEGYLLHLQRYMGFFTCLGSDASYYDFYLINELATGDLYNYLRKVQSLRELKVLLWQSIFSLHVLNTLEYFHQDASVTNIFYKVLKQDDQILGYDIFSAKEFVYRLEGREWTLPNVGKIVKVADFGFMTHLADPMVFAQQYDPGYRIENTNKGAYDISYFIYTLLHYVEKHPKFQFDLQPLFDEWFTAMNKKPGLRTTKELETVGILTEKSRPTELAEKWNPLVILDGPFFSEVLIK